MSLEIDLSGLTRKEKVLKILETKGPEVERSDIVDLTGIDSNLSKILRALEKENKIVRRYEQIGRAKYCYVRLSDKTTNSHSSLTNSHFKLEPNSHSSLTNSRTNSQNILDPDHDLDLEKLLENVSKTSDFKRLIYRTIVGKVWRGTNAGLDRKLTKLIKKIREIEG